MKQAVIYARSEQGLLAGQIAVCRLFAEQNGYLIEGVIGESSPSPDMEQLLCFPAQTVIIAEPSVLGGHRFLPRRMGQLNLAGKRIIIATEETSK